MIFSSSEWHGVLACAQLYFSISIEERSKKQKNVHGNIYACVLDLRSKNILETTFKIKSVQVLIF